MKLVVVESPYAGEVERNLTYARRAMADCLSRNEAPLASHLLYTQEGILDDNAPEQRKLGIHAGFLWALKAEKAIFYIDYGWSNGMKAAKEFYDAHRLPYEERTIGPNDLGLTAQAKPKPPVVGR